MWRLTQVEPGFDPNNLQTFRFSLRDSAWPNERQQTFYEPLVERLRAVPGVENAALTYSLPILGSNWNNAFMIRDKPVPADAAFSELPNAAMTPVTATYFETMRVRVIRGRVFDRTDGVDSLPVAVINETMARRLWPNEDPMASRSDKVCRPTPLVPGGLS